MSRLVTDYEHNCETWWDAARREATGNPPTACVGILDWTSEIDCSEEDLGEFIAWADQIPGWDEHPFVIFR